MSETITDVIENKIMDAVNVLLSAIPEISTIITFPVLETELENKVLPISFVFLSYEAWEERNRLENNQLALNIITYYKTDIYERLPAQGRFLYATIHKAIFINSGLNLYIQKMQKTIPTYEYFEGPEGVITQVYPFNYLNTYGNMFSQSNY